MPTALITGAGGQTGSYLCDLLRESGWNVHATFLRVGGEESIGAEVHGLTPHSLDITDTNALLDIIRVTEPDVIFNLAGISSVWQSWQNPALTMATNVTPVAAVLGFLSSSDSISKQVKLIQASSAEIYGNSPSLPFTEKTHINPINPYGISKATSHELVSTYRRTGIFASNAILFNHESPRRPDTFVTRKITSSVARIAAGKQEYIELASLDIRRDWGWAPDYAHALFLMAQSEKPDDYVIATGRSHSLRTFLERAFYHAGVIDWEDRVLISTDSQRPVDTKDQAGDPAKIRSELGWDVTKDFDQIIKEMVVADSVLLR